MTVAAIRRIAVPSPEELIDRTRQMVPEIRALAEETERNRNVLPHIIDKIRDAELLRTCRPKEFGGFEYDGETALRIALTISAACASTGWAVNGAVSNGRSIAHFPIEAQREVWDGDADPFTCACFAPTGTAVPVDGGGRLGVAQLDRGELGHRKLATGQRAAGLARPRHLQIGVERAARGTDRG